MSIEINLKGAIATSYLAQHYFRANPDGGKGAVLVMTSSIVGLVRNPLRVDCVQRDSLTISCSTSRSSRHGMRQRKQGC